MKTEEGRNNNSGSVAMSHKPGRLAPAQRAAYPLRQLSADELLFQFGEAGHECYLLISGAIAILNKDGEPLGEFTKPGEFFGGRAALFDTPRNATARVTGPGEVWALPAPALHRLQTVYPNILLHLRVIESKRKGEKPLISAV